MRIQLDGLERHGELVDGVDRYSTAVREELLAMSAVQSTGAPHWLQAGRRRRFIESTLSGRLLADLWWLRFPMLVSVACRGDSP